MNIKHIAAGILAGAIALTSCSDFTDIKPKGENLLSNTTDLELLLNYPYGFSDSDLRTISGDVVFIYNDFLSDILSSPKKTISSILIGWDEAGHDAELPELTRTDSWYTDSYKVIGKIANPIILNVDASEGPASLKAKIKAEAYVLRAWYHLLLVQKYARVYNPATADTDMGIIYMTEDMDIKQSHPMSTMREVYRNILSDLDEAISSGALPEVNINRSRVSLPCAYALKAIASMCIQDYDAAAEAAHKAIDINGTVVDYNSMTVQASGWMIGGVYDVLFREPFECAEDYFDVYSSVYGYWLTPYGEEMFEPGHAVKDKMYTQDMMYDYLMNAGEMTIGVPWTGPADMDSSWNNFGFKSTQMYLILAETCILRGEIDPAMAYLDIIRQNRIDPSVYAPLQGSVSDKATAIKHLKQTAHGENIYTVWNFVDRKRWTIMDDFKQTLTREIDGVTYTLRPESTLWVFPFPTDIMAMNPYLKNNF